MPGIVGLLTDIRRQDAEAEVARMLKAIRHHGSYLCGTWCDEALGLYVGWTAHRTSDTAVCRENGSQALLFCGEDFSDTGQASQSGDRTSDLLERAQFHPSFLASLNGRFHGILVDRVAARATLFNDRFGLQ